jgi:predicted metal-binding membrane protein
VGALLLAGLIPVTARAAPRREQAAPVAALLALAVLAWLVTGLRMAGMDAGPWTDPGSLGFYLGTWVVMMAAMMLPSSLPMVLVFRRVERARSAPPAATSAFVAGYLAVWAASGLAGYAALKAGLSGASSPGITPAGPSRPARWPPRRCMRSPC